MTLLMPYSKYRYYICKAAVKLYSIRTEMLYHERKKNVPRKFEMNYSKSLCKITLPRIPLHKENNSFAFNGDIST